MQGIQIPTTMMLSGGGDDSGDNGDSGDSDDSGGSSDDGGGDAAKPT